MERPRVSLNVQRRVPREAVGGVPARRAGRDAAGSSRGGGIASASARRGRCGRGRGGGGGGRDEGGGRSEATGGTMKEVDASPRASVGANRTSIEVTT
eukprot:31161-Pelagococcus_subviridis.AAC.2